MSREISLINGPNLNALGSRPSEHYGRETLEQIVKRVKVASEKSGYHLKHFQSNSEGQLVDEIQRALRESEAIIINPGAYSHTSIAIRDALEGARIPVIEIHISNIFRREEFRRHSYVSEVARGVVCGFGTEGYLVALDAALRMLLPKAAG